MYSVEEFLEQADQASDVDDDIERVVDQDDEAEEATENKDDDTTKIAPPKKARKPSNRPKLDAERLKGPRGLIAIEKLFSKVEFQGNGHEQEDLQAVMKTLHYWCHRLFPKYSFDDCLAHLERIGSKKPVITLKKKILFDLFEEDQPFVNEPDDVNPDTQEPINEFDLLLQQEPLSQRPVTPERIELTEEQKEIIERNRILAAERRKARLEALQQKQANENSSQDSTLTEEQKSIIEKNRQLAIEKLRGKNNSEVSTIDDVTNSQKSKQSVNFTELVDSFFPEGDDDENPKNNPTNKNIETELNINPEEQSQKTPDTEVNPKNIETEININDEIDNFIDEINTSETEEIQQNTESNEEKMDINSTEEDTAVNLLEIE